jgi:multidrug resistance efflux pump
MSSRCGSCSRFKLVRWGWLSGTISIAVGIFILATFLALFNYLTPSGRVTVTGRVVEVTPNVTGQIAAIPVKANDVLFQIHSSTRSRSYKHRSLAQSSRPRF